MSKRGLRITHKYSICIPSFLVEPCKYLSQTQVFNVFSLSKTRRTDKDAQHCLWCFTIIFCNVDKFSIVCGWPGGGQGSTKPAHMTNFQSRGFLGRGVPTPKCYAKYRWYYPGVVALKWWKGWYPSAFFSQKK